MQHQAIDKSNTFPHLSPLSIFLDSLSNKMPPKHVFPHSFILKMKHYLNNAKQTVFLHSFNLKMKHYHNNAKQTLNLRAQFNQYMNHNITKEFAFPQMDSINPIEWLNLINTSKTLGSNVTFA